MLAYVLAVMLAACFTILALTKGEEVQVELQAAPQQEAPKLSPRAKRRLASRGKPRYTKKNKKGKKIKG